MKRIATIVAFCLAGLLFGAEPAGFWRLSTPGRTKNLECQIVKDESALKSELKGVNWDMTHFPDVDWSNNAVVVIAPSKAPRGWLLSFFRLTESRTGLEVEWGWTLPPVSKTRTAEVIGAPGDGPAAIAVAFSKLLTQKSITCKEVTAR